MSIREKILETMRGRLVFRNEKHVTQKKQRDCRRRKAIEKAPAENHKK